MRFEYSRPNAHPYRKLRTTRSTCDLDVVPNRPRKTKVNCALINVRGLGGSASSLVVNRI